jgi:hypothetical protein
LAFYATKRFCRRCCCNCNCYKRMCCWQYSMLWLSMLTMLLLLHSYFATIERVLTRIVPILAAATRYIGRTVVVLTCCWFGLPLLWSCCQWWPLWHSRMRRRTMACCMLCLLLLSTGLFYTSCDAMRCCCPPTDEANLSEWVNRVQLWRRRNNCWLLADSRHGRTVVVSAVRGD